ncbi:GNAT family N-acetyltransferase [Demequina activiva]|uniref:N-acetyltransferase domain-containing protein n=1 Tax=Demequina activiva TaxID=1582364 RepID=A0A919Q2I6_9MICO|nr:GNAT family N-acetyltransferase [Demequina activiva]GIG55080.1 hypothetical protein Dac01nite_18320 [Demequina activiva]
MTDTTVTHDDQASRYEIHVDGTLAGFIDYELGEDRIVMVHTEVFDDFQGQGVAGTLAGEALADAVERDLVIVPSCPYIARYLERHEVPGARVESA